MPLTTTPPILIVAHGDSIYRTLVQNAFARRGWDVFVARDGPDARRLAQSMSPDAVVLEAGLAGESGWLTCDKLTREQRNLDVILIADNGTVRERRLGAFVGAAAVVRREDDVKRLLDVMARFTPASSSDTLGRRVPSPAALGSMDVRCPP